MKVDGADLELGETSARNIDDEGHGNTHQTGATKSDHLSQLNPQGRCCDVEDEAGHLNKSMHDPAKAPGDESHRNRADGKHYDEGDRGKNSVNPPDVHRFCDVEPYKIAKVSTEAIPIAVAISISVAATREIWELLGRRY